MLVTAGKLFLWSSINSYEWFDSAKKSFQLTIGSETAKMVKRKKCLDMIGETLEANECKKL